MNKTIKQWWIIYIKLSPYWYLTWSVVHLIQFSCSSLYCWFFFRSVLQHSTVFLHLEAVRSSAEAHCWHNWERNQIASRLEHLTFFDTFSLYILLRTFLQSGFCPGPSLHTCVSCTTKNSKYYCRDDSRNLYCANVLTLSLPRGLPLTSKIVWR